MSIAKLTEIHIEKMTLDDIPQVIEIEAEDFFEKVNAEYAVITSSNKNPEEMETLEALKDAGVKYYLTKNGEIYLESNGKKLVIKQ